MSSAKRRPFCLGLNVLNNIVVFVVSTLMHDKSGLHFTADISLTYILSEENFWILFKFHLNYIDSRGPS